MTRATPPLVVGAPEAAAPPTGETAPVWRRPRWVVLAAALVVLAVAGVVLWRASSAGPPPLTRADVDGQISQRLEQQKRDEQAAPPEAATAYQTILPSLVTVTSQRPGASGNEASLGAGVVVNADGSILTALHVVDGAQQVTVRFTDGTQSSAQVATRQPADDIAVLAVQQPPTVIVPAVLGGGLVVGDTVFAVGNPLGLTQSLTAGVVSGVGRSVKLADNRSLDGLIQFDAAVNPGNSGGPLLNRGGQVVGVVTGLANPAQQAFFVGVGFAVPISTAGGAAGSPQQ